MAKVLLKRGTRAQIDAAAAGGTLVAGEPYFITDEGRMAVGTSASAYASFAKEGEVAAPIEVVARPVNVSPASGATEVSRTATLTGNAYASSTGVAQGAVRVQVSATSDFSGSLLYDSGEKPPGNAVAIPGGTLSNGIAVQWRIAYKSASGQWSEWSLPTAFTTKAVDLTMTGGTLTSDADYSINTFTASGSLVVPAGMTADVLIVAGGASGGSGVGGGGGGGGVVYLPGQALSAGTYAVTVGAGGASRSSVGANGGNSSVAGLPAAIGGGGGGSVADGPSAGVAGGCGGGGAYIGGGAGGAGTPGQGFAGGNGSSAETGRSSGGGGAGGAGAAAAGGVSGVGGVGFASAISPAATHYGGGGGGGMQNGYGVDGAAGGAGGGGAGSKLSAGANGAANTGGGGGGGGYGATSYLGGAGGSGIVIIRYQA